MTFRLTETEFAFLKAACANTQISTSTVARKTVLAWAESASIRPKVDQRLAEIDDRLDALVKLLAQNRK